jgi:hypothetical protein
MSGTYVGNGKDIAVLVQLVETGDGHLAGRYEQVVLRPGGKVEDMNATLTGAADTHTVVLTLQPNEFLSGSLTLSGTFQGGLLHLTGGGNGANLTLNLVKGDEADFRAHVAALTELSAQTNAAQARREANERQAKLEADRLVALQNLTGQMIAFTAKADAALPKFPSREQQYHQFTTRMRAGLAREEAISGGIQAGFARMQLSGAIGQAGGDAVQFHANVRSAYETFKFETDPLLNQSTEASGLCRGAHVTAEGDPSPVPEPLNGACLRFFAADKDFRQRVVSLRDGHAHLETVWISEHRDQETIVHDADMAAQ